MNGMESTLPLNTGQFCHNNDLSLVILCGHILHKAAITILWETGIKILLMYVYMYIYLYSILVL